ncbi:MAG TPA: hypothetical protein VJQ52_01315 [Steroidobacteraceae bacterium]|nr:hypothetical protein [Steroidobacteraceae bacterium]
MTSSNTTTPNTSLRIARSLLLGAAVTLALAACGGGGGSQAGSPPTGTDPGPGPAPDPGPVDPPSGGADLAPVIYVADQTTAGIDELYRVDPAAPGGSVKLSAPLVAGGNVYDFALSPDGKSVLYLADQDIDTRYELYRVSVDAPGVATKLNPQLQTNRDVLDFVQTPDGSKVVYRADGPTIGLYDLYLVDLANPGAAMKLSGALTPGGSVRSGYSISPDSARVLYRADQEVIDRLELFSVAIASPGVSVKMSSQLVADGDVSSAFAFSPDSTAVAYVADQDVDGVLELYGAKLASPGVTARLNPSLTAGGNICNFKFSPDSQRVAYCADQDTDDVTELYTVALSAPGVATKLSPTLVAGGDVKAGYEFSSDSSFLVYVADQQVDEQVELFRVDIAAPGITQKINGTLVAEGSVWDFKLSPDSTHVGYIATQDDIAVYELYEVALAAPAASKKLSAPMAGAGLWQFEYSDDGANATYSAEQDSTAPELYRVEVANPGAATKLNSPIANGGGVWAFIVKAGAIMTP